MNQVKVNINLLLSVNVFLLICICVFTSCSNTSDSSLPVTLVIPNGDLIKDTDLSHYFSNHTIVVPFESESNLNGRVNTFALQDSNLVLFKRQPFGRVEAVDLAGKSKFSLSTNSEGPNVLNSIGPFCLDKQSNSFIIYDDLRNEILTFNYQGDFVDKKPSKYELVNDLVFVSGQRALYDVSSFRQSFENDEEVKAGVVMELQQNSQDSKILNRNNYFIPNSSLFLNYNSFFTYGEKVYYHQAFTDTLYQFNGVELVPDIVFKFKRNDQRKDLLSDSKSEFILQEVLSENIPYANFIIPLEEYIFVSYVYDGKEYFSFFNKSNGLCIFNNNEFSVAGGKFSGRLDYNDGVFLNQMFQGNYESLNREGSGYSISDVGGMVYTLLFLK